MERNSFVFYASWLNAIRELPRDIQGEVLTAIVEYGLLGETTDNLKPFAKAILSIVKPQIDANNQKYTNGQKGAEYGAKGGRPSKDKNPKETPRKPQENPKETPNVYDNDNDLDKKKILSDERIKEKALAALSESSPDYAKFVKWLIEKAPYCFEHMKLPTEAEFVKLKKLGTTQQITETIQQIENRKDLRKRYSSLYRTTLNWLKNE